jgi:hypothetical protein
VPYDGANVKGEVDGADYFDVEGDCFAKDFKIRIHCELNVKMKKRRELERELDFKPTYMN